LERTRKNLIEELIRIGRLIDPALGAWRWEDKNAVESPDITEEPELGVPKLMQDLEDLPVVEDVVERPYATKDMFSAPDDNPVSSTTMPLRKNQPKVKKISDSSDTHLSSREELPEIDSGKPFTQELATIEFPVEELAQELVSLIEGRVSSRSGEQLDDTFRDELTQAVTTQLESWLKYS
jgi:hypothetical protein